MNSKQKTSRIEISSDQLKAELTEIKERVGALETIASISNRKEVETFVKEHLKAEKGKQIMKECEEPRTREYLVAKLGFNSGPALDYYLTPLRDADLIHTRFADEGGTRTFEWSNLFKRLPKKVIKNLLGGPE